jgi:hypothetical protein
MAMTSSPSSIHSITFTHQLPSKLTHENYLSWKFLILPLAREHDMIRFLDGSHSPPPPTVPKLNGDVIPNPDFNLWSRQYQLLFL